MQDEDDNSLIFIRKYLLGQYFYQGWFEFEPEPFEIGYIDGKESGITSVERKFAILNSLLTLPCLLYTSPSPRDATLSRMPSSA